MHLDGEGIVQGDRGGILDKAADKLVIGRGERPINHGGRTIEDNSSTGKKGSYGTKQLRIHCEGRKIPSRTQGGWRRLQVSRARKCPPETKENETENPSEAE